MCPAAALGKPYQFVGLGEHFKFWHSVVVGQFYKGVGAFFYQHTGSAGSGIALHQANGFTATQHVHKVGPLAIFIPPAELFIGKQAAAKFPNP